MTESERDSPPDLEKRVVESLIRLREERGWSQSELARQMVEAGWPKYTQMTVSRTEKGERPIRLDEVGALADIFEVDMHRLWMPRELRSYMDSAREVEKLSDELYALIRKYLKAQYVLAVHADFADLAEDEISFVASQLLVTPERLARQARMEERSAKESVNTLVMEPANEREAAAEDKFWAAEKPKLRDLYGGLYGEHSEEA
ncbi:helix-turn-helix transcriptional regulator [Arthrobacter sp. B10-11]|uniref:helix-turn-helix domain-containing protein n=1 Tax=Arthrobacter sp. B10-11 TaxID=3081160 RepID=UPI002952DF97|nr:helix-turn-helix transcriptional regulator [Arthrobacter sp. B10-11]MDV8148535.1 helix-turn-helix transcriptional regulator [Arthrobacter sp. B10-11]